MSHSSTISPREHVIGDDNYESFFDVAVNGETVGRGRVTPPTGTPKPRCLSRSAAPVMSEDEIVSRASKLEKDGQRLSDLMRAGNIPCKNQASTNYCWINAPTYCVEVKRVLQGHAYVELSPASQGGPITNFRNVGGWGTAGLKGIAESGLVPASLWPCNAIDRRYNTDSNRSLAMKFRAEEWDEVDTDVRAVCTQLVLGNPVAVGLDWWGHEVTFCDVVVANGRISGIRFRNSWGMDWGDDGFSVLTGSKMIPDDAVSPRSVTAFDYTDGR